VVYTNPDRDIDWTHPQMQYQSSGFITAPPGLGSMRHFFSVHDSAIVSNSDTGVRVDPTNNDIDWTKKKQGHTSLVHDTGLPNGRHSK
jgi:hypothetical protein